MPMEQLARDFSYAGRGLWRERTFTLTAVATLAVALALITVVFTIFNAYVLRPYAVRDPFSLYEIRWHGRPSPGGGGVRWSESGRTFRWRDYEELRNRRDLFDAVFAERNRTVSSNNRPLLAAFVSGNYFEALGARIGHGRALVEFDSRAPGGDPVAVLSYEAWTRLYGRDPGAVGGTIRLNDQSLTIVGVAAEEFTGLNDSPPDVWVPVTMHGTVARQDLFGEDQPRELAIIARVRRELSATQVAEALRPLMPQLTGRTGTVAAELLTQATPAPLTLELLAILSPVFAAFLLILFTACANVSNVMLARAAARHREIGVRLSLGATRWRVVRQLLCEGLLIAVLAGATALGLAVLLLRAGLDIFFRTLPPSAAAIARVVPLDLDWRVFVFTVMMSAAATLLFALVPALHATRISLTGALRGELGGGVRTSGLRSFLVIGQVAVSLVLIVAASTLGRNALRLSGTDVGFETRGLISVTQRSRGGNLIPGAFEALARDPRIGGAAVTSRNPLLGELPKTMINPAGHSAPPPRREGQPEPRDATSVMTSYMFVSPEYFETVGIPILRGRGFEAAEGRTEAKVGIVSMSAANALWPGADPLGRTIRVWTRDEPSPDVMARADLVSRARVDAESENIVIVGVAQDTVSEMVYHGGRVAHLYLPTAPSAAHAKALLVRGRSVQDVRPDAVRAVLQKLHPNPLAFEAITLDEALALQMYPLTMASWIGILLSAIALVLSVSGVYGVMAYAVSQRTREIGIRMALGATAAAVVRFVLSQTGRLVVIGASLGLVISFSALAFLRAVVQLQNLSLLDAGAFAVAVAIVAAATGVAAYFPSRRATRVDPSHALRADG